MNIGFWNIGGQRGNDENLIQAIWDLIRENDLDVIFFAEMPDNVLQSVLEKINIYYSDKFKHFNLVMSSKDKVITISHYDEYFEDLSGEYFSPRWSSFQFTSPINSSVKLNLIAVHFPSKVNWSDISLSFECARLREDVLKIESITKHSNTILIGDFNMNPFEAGMVASMGLNAHPVLNVIEDPNKRGYERKVNGNKYHFFYNPMWNFLGDFKIPYGTFYHSDSQAVTYHWHILDQILVRPQLSQYLNKLDGDFVKIINQIKHNEIEQFKLTGKSGIPRKKEFADHLPIVLKLNLNPVQNEPIKS